MINEVRLLGNVGTDPEYTAGEDGSQRAKFSVATTRGYKEKAKTTWHNVTAFGKTADACRDYLKKGNRVYLGGSINNYEYEKDGVKHYGSGVNANEIKFLTPKGESSAQGSGEFTADDIPF